ncbi:MAG: UDP-N-acetylmuramoyl-tripeptide--D-alanyl-D-alanine ligase [Arenicellales bacterium]|nr:UDP-N-acetylmuramoyl-tripeptide--D-alanyl-D-alanine ligase [Arenicellales bacterium]
MDLHELASAVDGELLGSDGVFKGVSTDTRTIQDGDLFVALEGPNFDGHVFLSEAQNKRAVGAMVSHAVATDLPQVTVEDTRLGLGVLAGYWRNKFDCPVVAVTGSNGKTTVKEMIGSILKTQGEVLISMGNLNNDIGLPLMLCRLRAEHLYAVLEMGMNRRGEIDYLTHLARPQVAVITNAAQAHLEGLGSVESVAEAKAEIFNGLEQGGVAIINSDDDFAPMWQRRARDHRSITFGIEHPADVTVNGFDTNGIGSVMTMCTPLGVCEVALSLPGRHNVMNALSAAAAAIAVGVDLEHIQAGLESMTPVVGRQQIRRGKNGATVIDDSYNANPDSVAAAVQVLAAARGRKIFVMGDMAELGSDAENLHQVVGRQARQAGVDYLLAIGRLSPAATEEFGEHGKHFADKNELIDVLGSFLSVNTTILVKGSRSMRMEEVVRAITDSGTSH